MRHFLLIFEESRSLGKHLRNLQKMCKGKKERCFGSYLKDSYQVKEQGL